MVKRLLEINGVNWGYFLDHNPFEPHCNSHPNNFIVLPPVRMGYGGMYGWVGGWVDGWMDRGIEGGRGRKEKREEWYIGKRCSIEEIGKEIARWRIEG